MGEINDREREVACENELILNHCHHSLGPCIGYSLLLLCSLSLSASPFNIALSLLLIFSIYLFLL